MQQANRSRLTLTRSPNIVQESSLAFSCSVLVQWPSVTLRNLRELPHGLEISLRATCYLHFRASKYSCAHRTRVSVLQYADHVSRACTRECRSGITDLNSSKILDITIHDIDIVGVTIGGILVRMVGFIGTLYIKLGTLCNIALSFICILYSSQLHTS